MVFIVNAENPAESISSKELKDYFFKRKPQWPDGSPVRFIDRNESPERKLFLEKLLRQTSEEIDTFWIGQKLYSGNSAPVQAASQSMVIYFVATFKGAIGYVSSASAVTDKKVKVIKVTE